MNNTLHTWQISFGNIVDQNKKTICFLPERKNNDTAHLISAAPELLSALDLILNKINAHGLENKHMIAAIEKAELAIAKAEGREK